MNIGLQMVEKHCDPCCESDSYFLTLLSCVFCAFLCAAARPQSCTGSQKATKRETLRTSGGPRLSEEGTGEADVGGGSSGLINLPELVCESLRDRVSQAGVRGLLCWSSPHREAVVRPTPPASVHPLRPAPRVSASGNRALWSPLIEDVWLLCPLLNLGSDLRGHLCNPNIADTWRRWKATGSFFTLHYYRAVSLLKCAIIQLKDLSAPQLEALSLLM